MKHLYLSKHGIKETIKLNQPAFLDERGTSIVNDTTCEILFYTPWKWSTSLGLILLEDRMGIPEAQEVVGAGSICLGLGIMAGSLLFYFLTQ